MRRVSKWPLAIAVGAVLMTAAPATAAPNADRAKAQGPVAKASGCSGYRGALAGQGRWLTSTSDCAVLGRTGHRVGYSWVIAQGTNTRICAEGRGYVKSGGKTVAKWYSLGCGTGGKGTVPWGNVAGNPAVRAKVQLGFLGGLYRWAH